MIYTAASVIAGLILPQLDQAYLAAYTHDLSAGSALAFFSVASSGMMTLTHRSLLSVETRLLGRPARASP